MVGAEGGWPNLQSPHQTDAFREDIPAEPGKMGSGCAKSATGQNQGWKNILKKNNKKFLNWKIQQIPKKQKFICFKKILL